MPKRNHHSPLGQTQRQSLALDATTRTVINHVAARDNISLSAAACQLILGFAVQVPELRQVVFERVQDVVHAELLINGLNDETRDIVSEALLGRGD